MIVGHEAVREELEQELPPVILLIGPRSVGKTTLAHYLAEQHQPSALGRIYFESLNVALAREIVDRAPAIYMTPVIRIIDMDYASEAAQNILLKVLEEPPAHCRFILIASRNPLPTIMSRCRIYPVGLLTEDQVARVLQANGLASEHEAVLAAARGRGQVSAALAALTDRESARITSVVAAAVRAATAGGGSSLDLALRNWTPEHTAVLRRWATEAASGRWVVFTEDFASGVSRDRALNMLYTLSTYEARTAAAVALDTLKEKQ